VKRYTRNPSVIFQNVLKQAEEQLALAARQAANFEHKGIRGDERANALREFFVNHLPSTFATRKGEAIDYSDTRTGQIDFCIYDAATASPIQASSENALIPAEALYAVVEVKSVLTRDELEMCVAAAKKVRQLRPFKQRFGATPLKFFNAKRAITNVLSKNEAVRDLFRARFGDRYARVYEYFAEHRHKASIEDVSVYVPELIFEETGELEASENEA